MRCMRTQCDAMKHIEKKDMIGMYGYQNVRWCTVCAYVYFVNARVIVHMFVSAHKWNSWFMQIQNDVVH